MRIVQNVEQARPTDMSEEEMQLNLALQLSKQHAEEEERLKYALINCSVSIFLSKGGSALFNCGVTIFPSKGGGGVCSN